MGFHSRQRRLSESVRQPAGDKDDDAARRDGRDSTKKQFGKPLTYDPVGIPQRRTNMGHPGALACPHTTYVVLHYLPTEGLGNESYGIVHEYSATEARFSNREETWNLNSNSTAIAVSGIPVGGKAECLGMRSLLSNSGITFRDRYFDDSDTFVFHGQL